jgi:hypothetical protein
VAPEDSRKLVVFFSKGIKEWKNFQYGESRPCLQYDKNGGSVRIDEFTDIDFISLEDIWDRASW